jgi:septal ring factor EnvC (AmiA/AmiB activator)
MLLSSQKDVKSKLANLDVITARIGEHKALMQLLNNEVNLIDAEMKTLDADIAVRADNVERSRKEYAESLRRARRYSGMQNRLMFIFSADNFNTMVRRYRYVNEYMGAYKVLSDSLKSQISALETKRAELEATRLSKSNSIREQNEERVKLQQLEGEQRKIVKELQRESNKVQKELKKKRDELDKLNKSIEREIERVLAAEREAKRKAEQAKKQGAKTSSSKSIASATYKEDAGVAAMTGSFEKNRKKMPVPITGPYLLVDRFGVKNAVEGKGNVPINTGGVTFQGDKGAKARCIFEGKVTAVFGSGNYVFVLVRHGKYISVYCNLENIRVKGGEDIKAGDIIGDIAVDAKVGYPRMLFQIRLEKKTLDPTSWLKM